MEDGIEVVNVSGRSGDFKIEAKKGENFWSIGLNRFGGDWRSA